MEEKNTDMQLLEEARSHFGLCSEVADKFKPNNIKSFGIALCIAHIRLLSWEDSYFDGLSNAFGLDYAREIIYQYASEKENILNICKYLYMAKFGDQKQLIDFFVKTTEDKMDESLEILNEEFSQHHKQNL